MAEFSRPLIVCPTYNERDNIAPLVTRTMSCVPPAALLFVDDRGDDGTEAEVVHQQRRHSNIFLLAQKRRGGLAKAYLAGFAWGLARDYDCFVTMDADLSHDPVYLLPLLQLLAGCDVAIGSRYVAGGGTGDWGWSRQLLSRGGARYARMLLGLRVYDPTSGLVAFRRAALEKLALHEVQARGYVFQIELKYRALLAGCVLQEMPIVFTDRKRGESKMSLAIVLEAALSMWRLRRLGRKQRYTTPMLL